MMATAQTVPMNVKQAAFTEDNMAHKYNKMTDEDFDRILAGILDALSGEQLLQVSGVYEAVSEHFNNEVLEIWEQANPDKIPPEFRTEA